MYLRINAQPPPSCQEVVRTFEQQGVAAWGGTQLATITFPELIAMGVQVNLILKITQIINQNQKPKTYSASTQLDPVLQTLTLFTLNLNRQHWPSTALLWPLPRPRAKEERRATAK